MVWVSMKWDIASYIQTCPICAYIMPSNQNADTSMWGRWPWEVITLDLMGPYPRPSRGKMRILVISYSTDGWRFSWFRSHDWMDPDNVENWSLQSLWLCRMPLDWQWLSIHFPSMPASTSDISHWTLDIFHLQPKGRPNRVVNQKLKRMLRIQDVYKRQVVTYVVQPLHSCYLRGAAIAQLLSLIHI